MADTIDMLSVEELTELLELRAKMDEIQARYNELTDRLRASGTTILSSKPDFTKAKDALDAAEAATTPAAPSMPPKLPSPAPAPAAPAPKPPDGASAKPPPVPGPAPTPAATGKKENKATLTDRCVKILKDEGKGMTFDQVYAKLETDGYPMPEDKPKLRIRAVLQNKTDVFAAARGEFTLK